MNDIANKTINYRVYGEVNGKSKIVPNTTDVTLPDIELLSDSIKGAGIQGEIDWPSLTETASMSFSYGTRVVSDISAKLYAPGAQRITVRWATEVIDKGAVASKIVPHKATIIGVPKKFSAGKIEKGSAMDTSYDYEVLYYRLVVDGDEVIEIDKLNEVFKVDGYDYGKAIRDAL